MLFRSAPPGQVAYIDFYFANGDDCAAGDYDFAKEIVALGILNKVIVRAGAYYRYDGRQWQGADAVVRSIREEPDLKTALDKDVLDAVKASSKGVVKDSDED